MAAAGAPDIRTRGIRKRRHKDVSQLQLEEEETGSEGSWYTVSRVVLAAKEVFIYRQARYVQHEAKYVLRMHSWNGPAAEWPGYRNANCQIGQEGLLQTYHGVLVHTCIFALLSHHTLRSWNYDHFPSWIAMAVNHCGCHPRGCGFGRPSPTAKL